MGGCRIMNFFIKDHHFTRQISSISCSKNGMFLIMLEPTPDYNNEHLIFQKEEFHFTDEEILLIRSPSK